MFYSVFYFNMYGKSPMNKLATSDCLQKSQKKKSVYTMMLLVLHAKLNFLQI